MASVAKTNPSPSDPASQRKTFLFFERLNLKKSNRPVPINVKINKCSELLVRMVKAKMLNIVVPAESPSIQSLRLTAFIINAMVTPLIKIPNQLGKLKTPNSQ